MNTGNDNQTYYTIKEVSEITGVKQTVLRFWEMEFEQLKPRKNKFGHRIYINDDIKTVKKIKSLLYEKGLTIKGAKKEINEKITISDTNIIKSKLLELLSILKINNKDKEEK